LERKKIKTKELSKCSEVAVRIEGPAVSQYRRKDTFNEMLKISCKPYEH
jgi:hypothetical protein